LVERLADRVVLAHPKKLRIIAQSKYKTDKIDAGVLAEFLALDMIPEAYRPTPRQRQHRAWVRYRYYVQKRTVSVRNKMRHILANYNADVKELFTVVGLAYLRQQKVSAADRFVLNHLLEEWREHRVGKKKAIVAVARRVFCVIMSMLRSGQAYRTPGGEAAAGFRRDGKGVRGEPAGNKPAQKPPASPRQAAARERTADHEAKPREVKPEKTPQASRRRPRREALSAHP
jgi:hypothetical protein